MEYKCRKLIMIVRAVIQRAVDRMIPLNIFLDKSKTDRMLECRSAAPGDGGIGFGWAFLTYPLNIGILRKDDIDRSGIVNRCPICRKNFLNRHVRCIDTVGNANMILGNKP